MLVGQLAPAGLYISLPEGVLGLVESLCPLRACPKCERSMVLGAAINGGLVSVGFKTSSSVTFWGGGVSPRLVLHWLPERSRGF